MRSRCILPLVSLALAALPGCGSGSRGTPAGPGGGVIANVAPPPADAAPSTADPACVTGCIAQYPDYPDEDGAFAAYCDRVCTETDEVGTGCAAHCEAANSPSTNYDDYNDYDYVDDGDGGVAVVPYEPEPVDEDAMEAMREGCVDECRGIPDVYDVIDGCVAACVYDADPETDDWVDESNCKIDCDPDPYDTCVYQPCD